MQGVITRVHVIAHPVVVFESFGMKVLLRSLFAGARETFLDIVSACAEEEEHAGMAEIDLLRTVKRFIGFERHMRDIYQELSRRFPDDVQATRFFRILASQEEGHAIVLSRVQRELRRGRLWRRSNELHVAAMEGFEATLDAHEQEVGRGVTLARSLEIVEAIEGSEINVVFDTLHGAVDMRSRARFERLFVLSRRHLAYFREQVKALRVRHGIAAVPAL
jgi:rubrerythrin